MPTMYPPMYMRRQKDSNPMDNSKDRTTIYLSEQSKADVQAIRAAHPYLKSTTAAIAFALHLAAMVSREAQGQANPLIPIYREQ